MIKCSIAVENHADTDALLGHVEELHNRGTGGVVSVLAENSLGACAMDKLVRDLCRVRGYVFTRFSMKVAEEETAARAEAGVRVRGGGPTMNMSARGFKFPEQCDKKKVFFAVCGPNTQRKPFTQRFFRAAETKKKESGLLTKERHDAVVVIVTCGKPNTHIKIFWQNDGVCYLHKKDDEWRKSHLGGQLRCVLRDTKLASSFVRGGKVVIGAGQTRDKPVVDADPYKRPLPRQDNFVQQPFGPQRPSCNGVSKRQVLLAEDERFRAVQREESSKRKRAAVDKEGVTLFLSERDDGQPWRGKYEPVVEPTPAKKMCEDDPDPWEHPQPGIDYFDNDDDGKGFPKIPLPLVPYPCTLSLTEAKAAIEQHRKSIQLRFRGQAADYETLPVQVMVLRNDE